MPSVMDALELVEYGETHDLHIETLERPQPRRARPGFWHTLAQKMTRYLPPTRRERHAPVCSTPRPFETSIDRLVREHPSLAVYALALI